MARRASSRVAAAKRTPACLHRRDAMSSTGNPGFPWGAESPRDSHPAINCDRQVHSAHQAHCEYGEIVVHEALVFRVMTHSRPGNARCGPVAVERQNRTLL